MLAYLALEDDDPKRAAEEADLALSNLGRGPGCDGDPRHHRLAARQGRDTAIGIPGWIGF